MKNKKAVEVLNDLMDQYRHLSFFAKKAYLQANESERPDDWHYYDLQAGALEGFLHATTMFAEEYDLKHYVNECLKLIDKMLDKINSLEDFNKKFPAYMDA